jgi:hypothetical protein
MSKTMKELFAETVMKIICLGFKPNNEEKTDHTSVFINDSKQKVYVSKKEDKISVSGYKDSMCCCIKDVESSNNVDEIAEELEQHLVCKKQKIELLWAHHEVSYGNPQTGWGGFNGWRIGFKREDGICGAFAETKLDEMGKYYDIEWSKSFKGFIKRYIKEKRKY